MTWVRSDIERQDNLKIGKLYRVFSKFEKYWRGANHNGQLVMFLGKYKPNSVYIKCLYLGKTTYLDTGYWLLLAPIEQMRLTKYKGINI